LLALAIARRVSGIYGLGGRDGDIATLSLGSMTIRFLPEFRAKNDLSGSLLAVSLVEVKSLLSVVDPEDTDRFLCPVRALKCYLLRSASFRASKRQLFVSLNRFHKRGINRQTLARWIKAVVLLAYNKASLDPPGRVKAKETRAIASSLARARGISLQNLMTTAFWKRENTFLSYYLRDLSSLRQDSARVIRHLVAANFVTSL